MTICVVFLSHKSPDNSRTKEIAIILLILFAIWLFICGSVHLKSEFRCRRRRRCGRLGQDLDTNTHAPNVSRSLVKFDWQMSKREPKLVERSQTALAAATWTIGEGDSDSDAGSDCSIIMRGKLWRTMRGIRVKIFGRPKNTNNKKKDTNTHICIYISISVFVCAYLCVD